MIEKVGVQGLAEFNRSLRRVSADAPKGLRVALNEAADHLITKAKPQIPRRTGAAADSLKAKSTRTAVRVGIGGRRAPYVPWLDFGGRTGRNRSVVRPFYKEGRYLYPTLREERPEFTRILEGALVNVVRSAGLEVD